MNAIFIRQDPPFDLNYISNTYLLDRLKKPLLVNSCIKISKQTKIVATELDQNRCLRLIKSFSNKNLKDT